MLQRPLVAEAVRLSFFLSSDAVFGRFTLLSKDDWPQSNLPRNYGIELCQALRKSVEKKNHTSAELFEIRNWVLQLHFIQFLLSNLCKTDDCNEVRVPDQKYEHFTVEWESRSISLWRQSHSALLLCRLQCMCLCVLYASLTRRGVKPVLTLWVGYADLSGVAVTSLINSGTRAPLPVEN